MLLDSEVVEDVNAAVDYLIGHRFVRNEAIGIMGFCMGGRVSYLMTAVNPAFKAA
jgi:dienelactone hydrolase